MFASNSYTFLAKRVSRVQGLGLDGLDMSDRQNSLESKVVSGRTCRVARFILRSASVDP